MRGIIAIAIVFVVWVVWLVLVPSLHIVSGDVWIAVAVFWGIVLYGTVSMQSD